jgi:hypothetical protein
MSAMTRDYGDFAAFCLHPSAHDPPGGSRFVANKDSTAIRPNGDRTVESLFSVFQPSNPAQFQPDFFVLTVRSAEGRKGRSCWLIA